jgi:O-antigen/teichoic acid export membrane protein
MSLSLTSLFVVMIRIVGVAFQALIIVVLANSISVTEMGLFSAIYIFWGLMRALGPLGLDQLSMRDIATFAGDAKSNRAQAVSNFSIVWVAAAGLLVALVTYGLLNLITQGGSTLYSPAAIVAASLAAPAYAMNGLLVAHLRGFGRTIQSQVSEVITLHALSLAAMGVLAWQGTLTLEAALVIQAAAAWIVMAIYAFLRVGCGVDVSARLTPDVKRSTIADAFQIWQALSLGGLYERAPTYISLALLGPAATAIVDIANRFGSLPTIFTDGVATTFSPVFAQLFAGADADGYRAALTLSSWLAFLPAFGALTGLLVLGPWLLDVFFPASYQAAFWPMVLICAGTTINAAFGMASCAYMVTSRQTLVRLYTAYSLVFILVACAVMGWFFGPTGIAAAICLGAVIRDGGLARILARDLNGPVMLDPGLPKRVVRTAWATAR